MLDKSKRENVSGLTVKELIHALSKRPQDAKISCSGDCVVYIHETVDGKVVSFDYTDLEDYYKELEEGEETNA